MVAIMAAGARPTSSDVISGNTVANFVLVLVNVALKGEIWY